MPKYDETIDALLAHKEIDVTIKNKDGKTALDIATNNGWLYGVSKLKKLTESTASITPAAPIAPIAPIAPKNKVVVKRIPSTRPAAIKARQKIAAICK